MKKPYLLAASSSRLFALVLAVTSASSGAVTPLRESFDLQIPALPTPVTVDSTQRLVYELHLTNFAREPLLLTKVEVLDATRDDIVASFAGKNLTRRLARPGAPVTDPANEIAPGMRGVLYLEIALPQGVLPRTLDHRIEYTVANAGASIVEGGRVTVGDAAPLVLGAPLRGGPWAAIHSPDWERGHRRVLYTIDGRARIPGRFAIDWVRLDDAGRTARGDADKVGNSYGYGAEVLAVADATVAATRDDVAESDSISTHPKHALGDATGNYVALDLGGGRYAFYEHLKPGSLRVKPGQRVRRGEAIAALGFTGDSTGPHLHFHVADANSPLGAEGVPFVLDRFEVLGAYPDISTLGTARWTPRNTGSPLLRKDEMPGPNVVVGFE